MAHGDRHITVNHDTGERVEKREVRMMILGPVKVTIDGVEYDGDAATVTELVDVQPPPAPGMPRK